MQVCGPRYAVMPAWEPLPPPPLVHAELLVQSLSAQSILPSQSLSLPSLQVFSGLSVTVQLVAVLYTAVIVVFALTFTVVFAVVA
jgi:hypothetical protein